MRLQSENKRKRNETQVLRPCQKAKKKKGLEHDSDDDTKCKWRFRNDHQRIGKGTEMVGNRRTSRDHPKYRVSQYIYIYIYI